ncbi:mannan endo-1,4-beta-mannosidase 2 isoform X2 [Amborella trichopoda]|uniref:mannan endo-1,4-beta-mannosidase n=1 Tax=Amborella trichopoda TaxID=13333 RepID=U5D4H7_AMBTC|nr:mannan endo-1,4-beta-mannosidase 2 isoform X2 [Amborella trichopoda]ERN20506.1 hypothetical protein AMTR_s00068p00182430 [Amborella trichopoda]|eukprot:XP_006859039.1 mannan endo-1,4-beta-mannosidase 2 isoform X2 [Amborella trichopoda]
MVAGNGLLVPILGFASSVAFIYMTLGDLRLYFAEPQLGFVEKNGTQFMVDGKAFYVNGWNSYWLMDQAVEEFSRPRVRAMLQAGARMGLTVCRTWAFNDGGYNALQLSLGTIDERVFKGLDRVIAEARHQGIRLILCLVNNLHAYGGKGQYVQWALEQGAASSSSNDSFFSDPFIRSHFKNYMKTILTRRNSLTGIKYKDDPTIFAWEIMNEPRCKSDPSGDTLQGWIKEMAEFVKSIDNKHLLSVGNEGFYGPTTPEKFDRNPGDWASSLGVDFIRNNMISAIDFASVHAYPDNWFPEPSPEKKLNYLAKWVKSHIEDGDTMLQKPVLFTEFGISTQQEGFEPTQRDAFYSTIYDIIYKSAKRRRSGAGAMAWQFLAGGMNEYGDAFAIVPWEWPSTYSLIIKQSCRLRAIRQDKGLVDSDSSSICS